MGDAPSRLPAVIEVADRPELLVRLWQVDDAPALAAAVTESIDHLRPFMPWIAQEPQTVDDRADRIRTNLQEWDGGGDAFYGIWLESRAVGALGAHRRIGPDGLELGYWLRPDAQGRGIMTAAVAAATSTLLALPGISHVEIRTDAANVRSAAVPRRCGFQLVGREVRDVQAPAETGEGLVWRIGADPAGADHSAGS